MSEHNATMIDTGPGASKRTYREAFLPDELKNRFGSKQDLIQYFSEHREYNFIGLIHSL